MSNVQEKNWENAQNLTLSLDLASAAQNHLKFLHLIHSSPRFFKPSFLKRAIQRYECCWLPLAHSNFHLIPPLDCAWIWHCHRLNSAQYAKDCKRMFGTIIDAPVTSFTEENTHEFYQAPHKPTYQEQSAAYPPVQGAYKEQAAYTPPIQITYQEQAAYPPIQQAYPPVQASYKEQAAYTPPIPTTYQEQAAYPPPQQAYPPAQPGYHQPYPPPSYQHGYPPVPQSAYPPLQQTSIQAYPPIQPPAPEGYPLKKPAYPQSSPPEGYPPMMPAYAHVQSRGFTSNLSRGVAEQNTNKHLAEESLKVWEAHYPREPYTLTEDIGATDSAYALERSSRIACNLMYAVECEKSFYQQICKEQYRDSTYLVNAEKRYKGFLYLLKTGSVLTPTDDIEFMWRTHQLSPVNYENDMCKLLGRKPNDFTQTRGLWENTFGTPYIVPSFDHIHRPASIPKEDIEEGVNNVQLQEEREVHPNVKCDECGMCPIRGPQYGSTKQGDYDICLGCYRKHADTGEFVRVETPAVTENVEAAHEQSELERLQELQDTMLILQMSQELARMQMQCGQALVNLS